MSDLGETAAWVERLPPTLDAAVLAGTSGDLASRVQGALLLRDALLGGTAPTIEALAWPSRAMARALARALEASRLLPFTRGHVELTDALLSQLAGFIEEAPADASEESLANEWSLRLEAYWGARRRIWERLRALLAPLGEGLVGFDLSSGLLHAQGLIELSQLQALLDRIPEWTELVRLVGRPDGAALTGALEAIVSPVRQAVSRTSLPRVPPDLDGIERTSNLDRMLPSEALLLNHPSLRLLWHARRTEAALLGHRVAGEGWERASEGEGATGPAKRGPVLIAVDVSASMSGKASAVVKALALEAARVAHQEQRRCELVSFGGPNEWVRHDLSFEREGVERLLSFLRLVFEGGTDPNAALRAISERLESPDFAKADLLVLSDGRFAALPESLIDPLRSRLARSGGRCHGVLVGAAPDVAMRSLCDPLHRFESWGEVGGKG